ncbi:MULTISPECIES: hypothetical protein [Microvirgula]|uniref:hypothetical protein n=1 Tax=Microvirgula TaxID=57479 RepID=UPI0011BEE7F5|nr:MULTISPECIES: hypothetical protein [Microvirgula]
MTGNHEEISLKSEIAAKCMSGKDFFMSSTKAVDNIVSNVPPPRSSQRQYWLAADLPVLCAIFQNRLKSTT